MNNKKIEYKSNKVLQGINLLADVVKSTLGPLGRTVMIDKGLSPLITKDGVTVAKEINVKDRFQNMGMQLMQEVANKTLETVGDATTTSIVLAQAFINNYEKHCKEYPPLDILSYMDGMNEAIKGVINNIKSESHTVQSNEDLIHIATISANNDKELGNLIGEAFALADNNGIITIEETNSNKTTLASSKGYSFKKGFKSSYFINDAKVGKVVYDSAYVLVVKPGEKIDDFKQLVPIVESIIVSNKSPLMIIGDVDDEVLSTIVVNRVKKHLPICVVDAPGFGESSIPQIEDVMALVEDYSKTPAKEFQLGRVDKVVVTKNETILVKSKFKNEDVLNEYANNIPEDRRIKLTGKAVTIKVGADTELEMKEKLDRIDDAVKAVKAALQQGYVYGGGTIFLKPIMYPDTGICPTSTLFGHKNVEEAIKQPFITLCSNSGVTDYYSLMQRIRKDDYVFNFKYSELQKQSDSNIIEPAIAPLNAITNAFSIAKLYIQTNYSIINDEETDRNILGQ